MTSTFSLIPNIDYYINAEGGVVFTKKYLLDRGTCCQSGCTHCPYNYKDKVNPNIPAELSDHWQNDHSEDEDEDNGQDN